MLKALVAAQGQEEGCLPSHCFLDDKDVALLFLRAVIAASLLVSLTRVLC